MPERARGRCAAKSFRPYPASSEVRIAAKSNRQPQAGTEAPASKRLVPKGIHKPAPRLN